MYPVSTFLKRYSIANCGAPAYLRGMIDKYYINDQDYNLKIE